MELAKYRLGKIKNKYLILEVLSFAGHTGQAAHLLFSSCKNLRQLIKENYGAFINILKKFETINIRTFSELLCQNYIKGKYLNIQYAMGMDQLRELAYLKNQMKAIYAVQNLRIEASSENFQDKFGLHEAFDFIQENFKPKSLSISLQDIDFDYMKIPMCVTSLELDASRQELLKYDETLAFPRTEIKRVQELIIISNSEQMHYYILHRVRPIESFTSSISSFSTLPFVTKLMNDYKFGNSLKQLYLNSFNINQYELYNLKKQTIPDIQFKEFAYSISFSNSSQQYLQLKELIKEGVVPDSVFIPQLASFEQVVQKMVFPTKRKVLSFCDDPKDVKVLQLVSQIDDITETIHFNEYSSSFQKKNLAALLDWIFSSCVNMKSLSMSQAYQDMIEVTTMKTQKTNLKHIQLVQLKRDQNFPLYEQLIAISRETLESLEFKYCEDLPIQSLKSSDKIKELNINYCRALKVYDIEVITSWTYLEKLSIYDTYLQMDFMTCFIQEFFPYLKVLHIPYIDKLNESCLVSGLRKLESLSFSSYSDQKIPADFLLQVLKNKKPGIKISMTLSSFEEIVKIIKETNPLNVYNFNAYQKSSISQKVAIDCIYKTSFQAHYHENPHIRVYNAKGLNLWRHIQENQLGQEESENLIRNFISDQLSVLVKFKSSEDKKRFYENFTSAHPSIQQQYLCNMIALLDKVRMIKDPKDENKELLAIPTELKFDKRYAMKGQKICKIQDEAEFRKQAQMFLNEYFQEFQKGQDYHSFCLSANIEEIKGVLLSIKSKQ